MDEKERLDHPCEDCVEPECETEVTEDTAVEPDAKDREKDLHDQLLRIKAEFDNYRKRTAKEREKLYGDAVGDTILAFLPAIDNLERAYTCAVDAQPEDTLTQGVGLVLKQIMSILSQLNVEPIKAVGEQFNHDLHNAIAHVDDDSCEQNVVLEQFQKGYIRDGKVIRHSIVKVAN